MWLNSTRHGEVWMSVTYVLFHLPTFLFICKQRLIMGITRLVNSLVSLTAFSIKLRKDRDCLLWSSGNSMCWRILLSSLHFRWGVFVWNACVGRSQQDCELFFEKRVPTGGSQILGGIHKRCAFHRSCLFQHWTEIELFLSCNRQWWGWPSAASSAWSFAWWAFGKGVGQRREDWNLSGWAPIICTKQRQLERSPSRSRPDIGDVLSFCFLQADFCACQHLPTVCIMANEVKFFHRSSREWILFSSGVPPNSSHCSWASIFQWKVHHQSRVCDDCRRWRAWSSALSAGFREEPALYSE